VPSPKRELFRLAKNERGAVLVEFMAAFFAIFLFFEGLAQLIDARAAKLIVDHAAYRGARAAAVVLPDEMDPFNGIGKLEAIRLAAARIVESKGDLEVVDIRILNDDGGTDVASDRPRDAPRSVSVVVKTLYNCWYPVVATLVCGLPTVKDYPTMELNSVVSLPVHRAPYPYPKRQ
jgi:hypothetical protein